MNPECPFSFISAISFIQTSTNQLLVWLTDDRQDCSPVIAIQTYTAFQSCFSS